MSYRSHCLSPLKDHENGGKVLDGWRKTNVVPIFKNVQEVYTRKHRSADLTLDPGKIVEQVLFEDISGHVKGKAFGCLTNLIAFYDKKKGFVDDGERGYLPQL